MIKFKLVILNKQKKNNETAIFLRLTQNKQVKYLYTGIDCNVNEWNALKESIKNSSTINARNNISIQEFKNNAINTLNEIPFKERQKINLNSLIEILKKQSTIEKTTNLIKLFDNKISALKENGKISSAQTFKSSKSSIIEFIKKNEINIDSITPNWLKKYQTFLKNKGLKDTSISIRMRDLRNIFNECITNKIISAEIYPFKEYKISNLNTKTKPRSIDIDSIMKIVNLDTNKHPSLKLAKDLFLFQFFCGGINWIDLIQLTDNNFTSDYNRLTYIRSKTKTEISIKIIDSAKPILEYYLNNRMNTRFVFPILLNDNLTPQQLYNRKHKTLSNFNKDLKQIGFICGLNEDLTSYVARHAFATNLKFKGVPIEHISELMGHQNVNITQTYLKKFETETMDNAIDNLNL
jgi:integrase/recombinase XerD